MVEGVCDDDVCIIGVFLREVSDGESLEGDVVSYVNCEGNFL